MSQFNARKGRGPRTRQEGMSLLDAALWLAIAAVMAFGIFYLVRVVTGKRVTTQEVQNAITMTTDLQAKFSAQASFVGISAANLIRLGIVPDSMVSGTTMVSGWSTPVTVAPVTLNGAANDGFTFTYQVPSRNCADFVQGVEGVFSRVVIEGTTVKNLVAGDTSIGVVELATCDATQGGGSTPVSVALSQSR